MNLAVTRAPQIIFLILLFAVAGFAQSASLQIPAPTGYVNDFAGKLTPATRQSLENLLTNFKARSDIEAAVVLLPFEQMQGYALEEYALQLGRQWGVGGAGNKPSFVLLVAIKPQLADGRYSGSTRLEISRHLEGDVPDGLAGELIRRMRVDFQNGRFDEALQTGVQTILATIAERRGFSMEGIDSSAAYRPAARRSSPPRRGISTGTIVMIVIIVFLIIGALRNRGGGGGGRGGGRGSDWWVGPVIWGGGGGGWGGNSGGSWGGSSGGGGSDWGGFGGGGDFGGGGASDNW